MIGRKDTRALLATKIMTTIRQREAAGWTMVHLHESVRMPPPDSAQKEAR